MDAYIQNPVQEFSHSLFSEVANRMDMRPTVLTVFFNQAIESPIIPSLAESGHS